MAQNRYAQIIEFIFFKYFQPDDTRVSFVRADINEAAQALDIRLPKNIGDVIYSFRYRTELPERILAEAPIGFEWIIRSAGSAQYQFALVREVILTPSALLVETKILDATPAIIEKYALSDEQALLAKLRYNRLIDIFTGLTCYSLQNHLRTTVRGIGQIETDEVYIGIDRRAHSTCCPLRQKGAKTGLAACRSSTRLHCAAKNSPT